METIPDAVDDFSNLLAIADANEVQTGGRQLGT